MLKKILIVLFVAIALFAIYVYVQPEDFVFERSTVINAPADVVFAQVNDFHKWDAWSPWAKLDPNSKTTFEGPASGEGAIFKWDGNDQVGQGKMTIVESKPAERIKIKLDFVKPMEATSDTLFTFAPQASGTKVTWTMSGKNNFIGRAMCLVMNMQDEMNKQFDKGLASMKSVAENPATQAGAAAKPGEPEPIDAATPKPIDTKTPTTDPATK